MRAPRTLEWPKPRAWPNSWAATISRLVPLSVFSVHSSDSSKWVSPFSGKNAWAKEPPGCQAKCEKELYFQSQTSTLGSCKMISIVQGYTWSIKSIPRAITVLSISKLYVYVSLIRSCFWEGQGCHFTPMLECIMESSPVKCQQNQTNATDQKQYCIMPSSLMFSQIGDKTSLPLRTRTHIWGVIKGPPCQMILTPLEP